MPCTSNRRIHLGKHALPALLLGALLWGWAAMAQTFWWLIPGVYTPQTYYKYGAVYTRAIVPGPSGRPVYVEYDGSGREAREIGEAVGAYERARVLSEAGDLLHQTANSIGLRVGFFGKDGKVAEGLRRDRQAQIHGPLASVGVTLGGHIAGGYALTDEHTRLIDVAPRLRGPRPAGNRQPGGTQP